LAAQHHIAAWAAKTERDQRRAKGLPGQPGWGNVPAMRIALSHITIDCADPYELAGFWHEVTGWPRPDDDLPGDPEASLFPPDGGTGLWFQVVPEPKAVKNRLHLDIRPTDHTRDVEVERVQALGATFVDDFREPDGSGWVVLADPDGNEFCVLRSDAERAATS